MRTFIFVQLLNAILLVVLFSVLDSHAADCSKRPIYSQIVTLKPGIDKQFATKLALFIRRYATKYNLNPHISVAIAMQETSLENKNRKQNVYVLENGYYKVVEGVTDVSLFQFHINTIQYYKLDPVKLAGDLEYAVASHFRIMADKMKLCDNLGTGAWACYHSKTKINREHYRSLVSRYIASSSCNEKKESKTEEETAPPLR